MCWSCGQLKDMAERLPVGAARNIMSPSLTSSPSSDHLNGQAISQEPDLNGSNIQLLSNGSSATNNRGSGYNKLGHSDVIARNGSRTKDGESHHETEWVEQDEPGVYITFTSLPGGGKDLKRVRFRYVSFQPMVLCEGIILRLFIP